MVGMCRLSIVHLYYCQILFLQVPTLFEVISCSFVLLQIFHWGPTEFNQYSDLAKTDEKKDAKFEQVLYTVVLNFTTTLRPASIITPEIPLVYANDELDELTELGACGTRTNRPWSQRNAVIF